MTEITFELGLLITGSRSTSRSAGSRGVDRSRGGGGGGGGGGG
eukprot:SAG31_NODE_14354_length_811_cov_5.487360_1_plen_42_part_01